MFYDPEIFPVGLTVYSGALFLVMKHKVLRDCILEVNF